METVMSPAISQKNRNTGSGSLFPVRSIQPRIPFWLPTVAAAASLIEIPRNFGLQLRSPSRTR